MKRVMVVDDAAFMRFSIRQILERNGFEVIGEAEDGKDAVEKYFTLKPDLVTMDISMPVLSGLDAVKIICGEDRSAKVVMISAMGQEQIVRQSIIHGAKTFIVKPFKEAQVVETINKLFES